MAAPSFVKETTGGTDASGAWAAGTNFGSALGIGNIVILHAVQDGSTSGAVVGTDGTSGPVIGTLAGTAASMDYLGEFPIGSPTAGFQHLWIARVRQAQVSVGMTGTNSTSEDLYWRWYEFADVSAGTTVATVLENGSAGSMPNGAGTGTTVSDTGVTTLGADRLALQFVGIGDDLAIDAFAGMTGGTWAEATAEYAESSGTDGCIQLQTATIASSGTINGGTDTIVSGSWGVVGFALIGTTASGPNTYTKSGFGRESA